MPASVTAKTNGNTSIPKICLTVLCAAFTDFLLVLLFALIALRIPGAERILNELSLALCALCGAASGIVCAKFFPNMRWTSALCALLSYLCLVIAALISGGVLSDLLAFLLRSALYGAGALIVIVFLRQKRGANKSARIPGAAKMKQKLQKRVK